MPTKRSAWHYRLWKQWHGPDEEPKSLFWYRIFIGGLLLMAPFAAIFAIAWEILNFIWKHTLGRFIALPQVEIVD